MMEELFPCPRCGQHSLLDTGSSEGPFLSCTDDDCEWRAGPFNTLVDLREFVARVAKREGGG